MTSPSTQGNSDGGVASDAEAGGQRADTGSADPGKAWSTRTYAIVLVLLYLLSLWVRVQGAEHRMSAGHGDVAGYYHVAKNLYAGRGFTQDYIADFLQSPTAVPTPSNTWWLPLPSIIAWAGMEVAGTDEFWAAKGAMIAVAALVPLIVFLTALLLLRSSFAALAAGLLAVGFHLYLDQPTVTLSQGPYSVFASAALLCVLGYKRWPRAVPLFGLFLGLTYLCRGDSQVLVAELAMAALAMRYLAKDPVAIPWKRFAMAGGLFVLVAAPWWVRNQQVLGELMPSGQKKVTWARSYEDWFTDTSRLTKDRYMDWGWENILDQKVTGVADAIDYTPDVMWRSVVRAGKERESVEADSDHPKAKIFRLGLSVLTPLMFLGLIVLLIRRPWSAALIVAHLCALALIYGLVFPAVARESYRSSMFSVMPFLLTAIIAPFWAISAASVRFGLRRSWADGSLVAIGLGLGVWNFVAASSHLEAKAAATEGTLAPYRQFGNWWHKGDRPDSVFFVRNPWQFTAETGLRSLMIPNTSADEMLDYAVRFDVQYFLDEGSSGMKLIDIRPGAANLVRRQEALQIGNPSQFGLYRISREALDRKAAELGIERKKNPAPANSSSENSPPKKSG